MRISVSPPATGTIAIRLISAAQRQSGTPTFFQVFRLLLRPIGRPTRKYLKATRPSPAGSRASHLRQRSLPCCTSQTSILTILYSASQDGQLNGIGSDWLIIRKGTGLLKIETYLEAVMRAARTCLDTLRRPTASAAPSLPLYGGTARRSRYPVT